jgi:hypothetical protein
MPVLAPRGVIEVYLDVAGTDFAVQLKLGAFEIRPFPVVPPAGGQNAHRLPRIGLELTVVEELVIPDALHHMLWYCLLGFASTVPKLP